MKIGGGAGGHNGIRSIDQHVGKDYRRVRIGIGHPGVKELVHGHVLGDFAKADQEWLEPLLDAIADNAELLVKGDDIRLHEQGAALPFAAAARRSRSRTRRRRNSRAISARRGQQAPAVEAARDRADGRDAEEALRQQGVTSLVADDYRRGFTAQA